MVRRCMGYGVARWFVNAPGVFVLVVLALVVPTMGGAAVEPFKLVVLGDSLTAGYGLRQADAFPALLEKALRRAGLDVRVINAGVSGDTTAGGLARLDWVLKSAGGRPGAVIVELGANDGLRGLDPALTRDNLDAIITRLHAKGIPVMLTGMRAPPNMGRAYVAQFNAVFPGLAAKRRVPFYPFFLDGVAAVPRLNQKDGVHPNAQGIRVIVRRILPHVKSFLGAK